MKNSLQVFNNGGFTARTITDDNGEIWFVAKDVAMVLGYPKSSLNQLNNLFKSVPEIWADHKPIMVRSENGVEQEREVLCLTEQGLYFFLGRSDKKAALPYQMWVAGEVVPSIRKHGFYATPETAEKILNDPDVMIEILKAFKAERAKVKELEAACGQWEAENNALAGKIQEDRPKVIFAEAVDASKDSILIGNLAKILRQNGIEIGQNRLFEWLRSKGFLMACRGERWNMPKQEYIDRGYFEIKKSVVNNPDGSTRVNHTPKITGKGQIFFIDGFVSGRFQI